MRRCCRVEGDADFPFPQPDPSVQLVHWDDMQLYQTLLAESLTTYFNNRKPLRRGTPCAQQLKSLRYWLNAVSSVPGVPTESSQFETAGIGQICSYCSSSRCCGCLT